MALFFRIVIFLSFSNCLAFGQEFPIQKYTPHQGLAQMQVFNVLKDSRGMVWAGTGFGLSRFNGESFTNYTTADGLLGNFISNIQEDNKGYIWISCATKGIIRFDGKKFKKHPTPRGFVEVMSPTFTNKGECFSIAIDAFNKKRLFYIVGDTLLPYTLKNAPKYLADSLIGVHFFPLTKKLILHVGKQLYLYQNGKLQKLQLPPCHSVAVVFKDEFIFRSLNGSEQIYYSWDGAVIKPFLKINGNTFQVINSINHDFVFVGDAKLFFLPKNTKQADYITENPPLATNLSFLNQPDAETLWLPTEKGLWQLTRRGFRQFSEEQVPYCWGVVEDKNKQLFFLNFKVSLQKFDGKKISTLLEKQREMAIPTWMKKLGYPSNDWYYKPLKDKFDNIWLPHVTGIFKYNYQKWQFFTHKQGDPLAFCLAEDKKRNKIVASGYNQLYTVQSQAPNGIEFIKDTVKIFTSLINSISIAPNHEYWFSGWGIGRYNPDNKQFKYYTIENHKIATKGILGLYFDWQGTLWAMSWRDGLFRYDPQKDTFERVLLNHFDGMINLLEQIDSQHLLIGNSQGLYILNLQKFNANGKVELKVYNHHNGYMGVEPGQLGSFRDSNGYIWITSSSVLTRMNPQELNLQKRTLKTFITKVGNNNVAFVNNNETINLPYGQNAVTFTVESIGEDKPFKSQYSFRIKGVLDKWSDWQEQNLLMVNNSPNGTHTIEVRSRLGTLDPGEYSIATQKFYISVPFYQSPNFYKYASIIGFILLLIVAYIWLRERSQTRKVSEQRKRIEEQENKVRFLQVQTIQAQMNPHFTFNVLGTLQHLILNNETQKASDNLVKLSSLIRNYLEASLLGDEQMGSLFKHEIALGREIELLKMYIEFEQLQYSGRFNYEIKLDGKLNPNNYRVPPLIIQPFVENAIKHGLLYKNASETGNLLIHFLSLDEDTLICTIEDDGVGREKAAELQLTSIKKYKSRGTQLVKKRIEILNEMGYEIEINIDDRLKGGTVVTIKIGYK
jgi:ligand-binding sensor domain-containing protein